MIRVYAERKKMKRLIISCGMLADELKKACEGKKAVPEILEQPRGMHEQPGELHGRLKQLIDTHQDVDEIVFTYGLCGYGTVGLKSPKTRLVLPKFDDCISQLLYLEKEGRDCRSKIQTGHIYLTGGWIRDQKSVLGQCREITKMYGEDAPEIINSIYGGYHTVSMIETGAYNKEEVEKNADGICSFLKLKKEHVPGSYDILERIISGNYDDNFIILNPGEAVTERMFRFNGR